MQAPVRPTSRVLRRHCRVSPQRRVIGFLCRSWQSSGACAGQSTDRRQVAAAHPAIEASPAGGLRRSSDSSTSKLANGSPKGGRTTQRISLAHGTVLGLGPLSSHLAAGDGRAISAELRHLTGKPAGRRVLRDRVAVCTAAREPEPFGAFCQRGPIGSSDRKRRTTGQTYRSQRWPKGCLARGVSPK